MRTAMIREIAGFAWSLPRSMSGIGRARKRAFEGRYAIGRLRKCCLGVYRHDQEQTGRNYVPV